MMTAVRTPLAALVMASAASASMAVPDLRTLFRSDLAGAEERIGRRGDKLSDETSLAAVVAGLARRPLLGGSPLIVGEKKKQAYAPAEARAAAFREAAEGSDERLAASLALSLVLEPPTGDRETYAAAVAHLSKYGESFDTALAGVLAAPEDLVLLSTRKYGAADAMVRRAKPRQAAALMALASADDPYLRSRGVASLGMLLNRDGRLAAPASLLFEPAEFELSAVIRSRIIDQVLEAARDKQYRVRAAAALALGVAADRDLIQPLDRLLHDESYIAAPAGQGLRRVAFPVAAAAAEGMARLGRTVCAPGGELTTAEAKRVVRGCRDITKDAAKMRPNPATSFHSGDW
ncbi:MAG: hypothetical protein NT029_20600 [Armatimonadetes bacterium]|nr:hypothetical protein [Armatimonadota bacterium]